MSAASPPTVTAELGRTEYGPTSPVLGPDNPWPGLSAFSEAGAEFFRGREIERDDLLRLVRRDVLTVLFGQSGLGKTSLINAGLFPPLRGDGYLPIYVRLHYSDAAPALIEQMRVRLLEECKRNVVSLPAMAGSGDSLWQYLHLAEGQFRDADGRLVTPIFFLDQFEEIFTLGRRPEVAELVASFETDLADLIANRPPSALRSQLRERRGDIALYDVRRADYKIVLSLREDFLAELETLQESMRVQMLNRMRLTRMSAERALQAIEETGRHLLEPDVGHKIIGFLAGMDPSVADPTGALTGRDVEPALLSLFCEQLNASRKAAHPPRERIGADLLKGQQERIIADFYAASFVGLDPRVRVFVEEELLTEGGQRDSAALEDAVAVHGVSREAVDRLVDRRLLQREHRFGTQRVELTHDVLTRVAFESRDRRRAAAERTAERARGRRRIHQAGAGVILMMAVAVGFGYLWFGERKATRREETAAADARRERQNALQALEAERSATDRATAADLSRILQLETADRFKRIAAVQIESGRALSTRLNVLLQRAARADSGIQETSQRAQVLGERLSILEATVNDSVRALSPGAERLRFRRVFVAAARRQKRLGLLSDSSLSNVLGLLAWDQLLSGDLADAERSATEAARLQGAPPWVHARLAHALYLRGDTSAALRIHEKFWSKTAVGGPVQPSQSWVEMVRADVAEEERTGVAGADGRRLGGILTVRQGSEPPNQD